MTICTDEFVALGRAEANVLGMPALSLAVIPHPVGGLPAAEVEKKADGALPDVLQGLTVEGGAKAAPRGERKVLRAKGLFATRAGADGAGEGDAVSVTDSPELIYQLFQTRGWLDGLPFVPPTRERVEKMLAYSGRDGKEVLAVLPPRWGEATLEKIAINAVMAGCLPQYFPLITTAVAALADPAFNLYAIQATTHPCSPLVLVNGPIARELDINGRYNALGQGWRSNATIGRAIRLILLNIGGGVPGVLDRATLGHPGKYSYCLAENEKENPWSPLHVERGFAREDSTVTVIGGEGPHNINDHGSTTARDILNTVAYTIAVPGSNNFLLGGNPLLLFGPEHAATVARDGFSKEDVKKYLFEKARVPLTAFPKTMRKKLLEMRPKLKEIMGPGKKLPLVDDYKDLLVGVAGGAGKHSAFVHTFGATAAVTRLIAAKDGSPLRSVKEWKG